MNGIGEILEYVGIVACLYMAIKLTLKNARAWQGGRYLCDTCAYNAEDLCHKPERPKAIECYSYAQGSPPVEGLPDGSTAPADGAIQG
jgi:hypothetical protein